MPRYGRVGPGYGKFRSTLDFCYYLKNPISFFYMSLINFNSIPAQIDTFFFHVCTQLLQAKSLSFKMRNTKLNALRRGELIETFLGVFLDKLSAILYLVLFNKVEY